MNKIKLNQATMRLATKQLNILLASMHVYYQNLRAYHWTIKGKNFFELHRLFEEFYNDAKVNVDTLAERILTMKQTPLFSLSEYLKHSEIKEVKVDAGDVQMIQSLYTQHEIIIDLCRECIVLCEKAKDEGTVDLLVSMLREIEKKNWMLRAWSTENTYHYN